MNNIVYENIQELAELKKIPIYELESKAGLGNGTISKWKHSSPKIDSLQSVAGVLGVSVARLLKERK